MLLVTYDIHSDKLRTKFAKFLSKYGHRLQFSVFKIKNSKRVLNNMMKEIEVKFRRQFTNCDSILIFEICEGCMKKIHKYGYAASEDVDILFMD